MEIHQTIVFFLEDCQSRELRAKTLCSYEQALELFAKWLRETEGIERVEDVRETTIRHYIQDLQTRGKYTVSVNRSSSAFNHPERREDCGAALSNVTINNYLRNLRVFFRWLTEAEEIERNPMKCVRFLPQKRNPREYLTDDEVKRLMRTMNRECFREYRDFVAMLLMLDSGMRLGETLSIEEWQIDLAEKSVLLPEEKTKSRKARKVFFAQKTARELRRWLRFKEKQCASEFLFPSQNTGRPLRINNYEANFRQYLERAEIEKRVSPHTLRNNFAKRCLMAGMDIYTLSRILGHSSVKTTERAYLDVTSDDLRQRYTRFSPVDRIFE